jgi:hypothetical protein
MGWICNDVFWELMSLACNAEWRQANYYYSVQFDLSKRGVFLGRVGKLVSRVLDIRVVAAD